MTEALRRIIVQNPTTGCLVITDVQVSGESIYPAMRAELLESGRLEDPDDCLTLMPGESFQIADLGPQTSVVTVLWEEHPL